MPKKPIILHTDHFVNKKVTFSFAKGIGGEIIHVDQIKNYDNPIATYGRLRGTGEAIKKSKEFWYIDHGYFNASKRTFAENRTFMNNFDGYFRIVHNNFWHYGQGSCKNDRLNKLNIKFKTQRKYGDYIILSEPAEVTVKYYKLNDWVNKTIKEIKKYSDRKIIKHNKHSPVKLMDLLKNAWAFVSDHSNAGLLAMINGVPSHYTNKTLQKISSIKEIESSEINYNIFPNLAYGQWTLKEMESGEAWEFLQKDLIK